MARYLNILSRMKRVFGNAMPYAALDAYRQLRYGHTWTDLCHGTIEATFSQVYRRNLWGGKRGEFYSGPGSDSEASVRYVEAVKRFVAFHNVSSIVDLGCGDFRVGSQIAPFVTKYHGIDVVPYLIARNQARFANRSLMFTCLDATIQRLPDADLCLIRQVLQHLSNSQIKAVLDNSRHFRHSIVTEHWPSAGQMTSGAPNRDIVHGFDTRLAIGSWVQLDFAPFDWHIVDVLCDVMLADGSRIRTMLTAPNKNKLIDVPGDS
jgi:SAM-dependent methyltransferase